jgi:hypothetical protein
MGAFTMGIAGCAGTLPGPGEPRTNIPPGQIASLAAGSAGYTGCMPEENKISNVITGYGGGGMTWNATCRDKVYLCSTLVTIGLYQGTYSCAIAVH